MLFAYLHSYLTILQAEAKATRLLIVVLAALHFGLALTFKVLFFGYYIKKIGPDPDLGLPGTGTTPTNATQARSF